MEVKKLTKILKALANERRLKILSYLLKTSNLTVGEISEKINLSFKSTSRHLKVLENADLIVRRQEKLNAYYSINPQIPKKILSILKF